MLSHACVKSHLSLPALSHLRHIPKGIRSNTIWGCILFMSSGESVAFFTVMFHRAKHIHAVLALGFVEECIFVGLKVDLFLEHVFFYILAFLMSCSSDLSIEYSLGRRSTYSAIGVPVHSSFILPITFLFVSSCNG